MCAHVCVCLPSSVSLFVYELISQSPFAFQHTAKVCAFCPPDVSSLNGLFFSDMSVCLSDCLTVCLSVYQSVCLSAYLSVCPSISLSVGVFVPVWALTVSRAYSSPGNTLEVVTSKWWAAYVATAWMRYSGSRSQIWRSGGGDSGSWDIKIGRTGSTKLKFSLGADSSKSGKHRQHRICSITLLYDVAAEWSMGSRHRSWTWNTYICDIIIGSAEALPTLCARCARWEREIQREKERERERERQKWRHHCHAKIGDEFTLSLAKIRTIAIRSHFSLPNIRNCRFSLHTSRLSFLKWSPLWRWNSQWVHTFHCQKISPSFSDSLKWRKPHDEWSKTKDKIMIKILLSPIIGSAEALPILCVRYFRWERERERETDRQRRKWRHHCRAKIGDEFPLSLAKNSHLAMSLHFPLPKIRTSRFSLHTSRLSLHGKVYHCGAENRNEFTRLPKFFSPSLFPLFQMARAARRVIENPRQMIKSYPVLFWHFCSSHRKNESN